VPLLSCSSLPRQASAGFSYPMLFGMTAAATSQQQKAVHYFGHFFFEKSDISSFIVD